MLPAALASSVVRPFYNRGASGPVLPTATPIGKIAASGAPLYGYSMGVAINLSAGETLVGGIIYDNNGGAPILEMDISGGGYGFVTVAGSFNLPTCRVVMFWLDGTVWGPIVGGNLSASFTAGTDFPTVSVMLATKVTGLKSPTPQDKTKFTSGGPATDQDSGLTAATTQAREFIYCLVGSDYNIGDTLGVWQDGAVAGQDIANTGMRLKEGYHSVNAIGTYRSRVTGATSRRFGARCETFKGV